MFDLLLDADSFNCLDSFGFLGVVAALPNADVRIRLTERVAKMELNSHQDLVAALQSTGRIEIGRVLAGTVAYKKYNEYRRRPRVDRGEAESIAWAEEGADSDTLLYVSNDKGARDLARGSGFEATDMFGLMVRLVEAGFFPLEALRSALLVWEDKRTGHCRPRGFKSFEEHYALVAATLAD